MTGSRPWRRAALGVLAGSVLMACAGGAGSDADARPGATSAPGGGAASRQGTAPAAAADDPGRAVDSRLVACPPSRPAAPVDGGLPDLTLGCLRDSTPVSLSGLRGTPLVVNVWASWCQPCAEEMPYLVGVAEAARGQVAFLGVDYADRRGPARDFLADFAAPYPSVEDPDGRTRAPLGFLGPPWTYFVDDSGRIVGDHRGQLRSEAQLRDLLVEHLGVRL